jgi:hypothetical protein
MPLEILTEYKGWVKSRLQGKSSQQSPTLHESFTNPMPANLEIATAPEPVRGNLTTLTSLDDSASTGQIESSNGEYQAQARQHGSRADVGGFKLKTVGFIIQKVLLNTEAPAVLDEGFNRYELVIDDIPTVSTGIVMS